MSAETVNSNRWPGYLPPGNIAPHRQQANVVDAEPANVAAGVVFGQPNEGLRIGTALKRITNASGVALEATMILQNISAGEKYYAVYGLHEPYELFLLTPDSHVLALIPSQRQRWLQSKQWLDSMSIGSSNQVVTRVLLPLGAAVTTNGNFTFLSVAKIPKGREQNEADVRGENQLIEITADDLAQIRKLAPSNLPPVTVVDTGSGGATFVMTHALPKSSEASPKNAVLPNTPTDAKREPGSLQFYYLSVCILILSAIVWLYYRRRDSAKLPN